MSNLGFLHFDWWLDEDGKHIWTRHDCNGVQVVAMLPWPNWHASEPTHERQTVETIFPSFHCTACDTHTHGGGGRVKDEHARREWRSFVKEPA